jgi:hypothetical protein
MEVALFANLVGYPHEQVGCRREQDEPMPERWPRPRRSRAATAALRAIVTVGLAAIVVAVVVVG